MCMKSLNQIPIRFIIFLIPFIVINCILIFGFKMDASSLWTTLLSALLALIIAEVFRIKVLTKK